jgi:predicted Zn-dependent protease
MTLPCLLVAAFLFPGSEFLAQRQEPTRMYFYLSAPDRSTPEAWRGEMLDRSVLAEWAEALEASVTNHTAPFLPVDQREAADVVVEIRRCQILDDGRLVIGGVVDPQARAVPFEVQGLATSNGLTRSLSAFSRVVRTILDDH